MNEITSPLRLAVGSHSAGSGKGCAMNLISWENGDTTITDLPDCADEFLARLVQKLNDDYCSHRDSDLLCPACSMVVLEVAHRTVGTGALALTPNARRVIWVKIAVALARDVLHLVPDNYLDRATRALDAAERWTNDPTPQNAQLARDAQFLPANAAAYACMTSTH